MRTLLASIAQSGGRAQTRSHSLPPAGLLRSLPFAELVLSMLLYWTTSYASAEMMMPAAGVAAAPVGRAPSEAEFHKFSFTITPPADVIPYDRENDGLWQSDFTLRSNPLKGLLPRHSNAEGGAVGFPGWFGHNPPIDLFHTSPPAFQTDFVDAAAKVLARGSFANHLINTTFGAAPPAARAEVAGALERYNAQSWTEQVEAFGTIRLYFIIEKVPAKPVEIDIDVDNPKIDGNAGIDYRIDTYRLEVLPWWSGGGWKPPVDSKMSLVTPKGLTNLAGAKRNITVPPAPKATFKSDLAAFGIGDLLMIDITARVWANQPGNLGRPPFPKIDPPGTPEPATWLLGLTGLAAVIGTQAWKSRQRMMRS
jgi:hypothetical protein